MHDECKILYKSECFRYSTQKLVFYRDLSADSKIKVAQELGLHREQSCLDTGPKFRVEQDLNGEDFKPRLQQQEVDLKQFEESAKVMLFWCVFIHEVCLVSRTFDNPSAAPWSLINYA